MKIVAAIYNHQEYYPPTLNAVEELSKSCDKIYLLARNIKINKWIYPQNVEIKLSGNYKPMSYIKIAPLAWKVLSFVQFTFNFFFLLQKHKPKWVICYDAIPLLSFRIVSKFIFFQRPQLWYHNHDIIDGSVKFSVSWWAMKSEQYYFRSIDIFSLPSDERRQYFPIQQLKGRYFFIPNFPAKAFYEKFRKNTMKESIVTLLYQGNLSSFHGIEETIKFISVTDLNIKLILIGSIKDEYKTQIQELIEKLNLKSKIQILPAVDYSVLPSITSKCHIGLAIHRATPVNLNYITGGTASNKIYEYAALGLPVFYYDEEHYNLHLSKYKWAVSCDLSNDNFDTKIRYILNNYDELSTLAVNDFKLELNFEKAVQPVISYIQSNYDKN